MDIPYGSDPLHAFITHVGLITSNGPWGPNVMAAEWTHQLSYKPGLIAVCISAHDATAENISATKEFGVNIASGRQHVFSSIAGNHTGKEVRKVEALKELGYEFREGKIIKAPMVVGAALQVECTLVSEHAFGDHVTFVGEALNVSYDAEEPPIAYHQGKYWHMGERAPKPPPEEQQRIEEVLAKHKRS